MQVALSPPHPLSPPEADTLTEVDGRVAGLTDDVDEETLKAAFVPFGPVLGVELPIDPKTEKHRGFGFVTFEEVEDAAEAIDNMHLAELFGSVLKVNVANPSKTLSAPSSSSGTLSSKRPTGAIWESEEYITKYLMDPSAAPPSTSMDIEPQE